MPDVSDVLRDRMHEPGGLQRMAALSVLAHAVFLAVLLLAPGGWWPHVSDEPKTVMTITLGGGGSGPQNGGMTSMGGRPVQAVRPPDEIKRPEAVRPPAAKAPEMTVPRRDEKPMKATAAPKVEQAPTDARGRTPTKGAEVTKGSAVAETGARGQGFGLSTGGGAGSGSYLDVGNFCCPDYLATMVNLIQSHWSPTAEVAGETIIRFTIGRDGTISDVSLEKSSGYTALDLTAQRAVYMTRQLPALPAGYSNPTLGVHLNFQYQR